MSRATAKAGRKSLSGLIDIIYDDSVAGPEGPQGPQGDPGPPGTTTWAGITDKPSTFAPTAHAASHAAGQPDALTLVLENRTDDPVAPATGRLWLRTDL